MNRDIPRISNIRAALRVLFGVAMLAGPPSVLLGQPAVAGEEQPGSRNAPIGDEQDQAAKGRGLIAQMSTFQTEVPTHPFDIVLVRPSPNSITASVVAYADVEGFIEFGLASGTYDHRTPQKKLMRGEPALFEMAGLAPGTAYRYRWRSRDAAGASAPAHPNQEFAASEPYAFRSARPVSDHAGFAFTIQADSHLDPNMTPAVYLQTLANALADRPEFHIDLGDTFMTDKRGRSYKDALPQYIAQRYYFGQLCHSVPLFMVLGNHDGEVGYANDGPDSMAEWSFAARNKYFPAPQVVETAGAPAMYSGRTLLRTGQGSNYYQFVWGDAQFIVLDPFWFSTVRPRGGAGGGRVARDKKDADTANTDENWSRTLGKDQYEWLARSLGSSQSRYKFVFIHHLVGGLGKANRGGVESSVYFEWGGKNADGSAGFAAHRPGWAMPIHDLLVKHHVAAVFYGHDHLYVRSDRDGVVYQCVPQPGNVLGGTRSAAEYGYRSGTIMGSPGYLRVGVGTESALVEFIRTTVSVNDEDRRGEGRIAEGNGTVVHQYRILPSAEK